MTPDDPIAEVRLTDLDPDLSRRHVLSFELFDGLEEDLAEAIYQGGPAGVREMGSRLAEAFSAAAALMEAAQRLGGGRQTMGMIDDDWPVPSKQATCRRRVLCAVS